MFERATDDNSDPLRGVLSAWFSQAKTWWGVSLSSQVLASAGGALSVLADRTSAIGALTVGFAGILGSVGLWRSESLRQRAESLLRHVEFEDGFGWSVDPKILADNLASAIPVAAKVAKRGQEQGTFYSGFEPVGVRRALDNLRESAWWTQQLAFSMGWITTLGATLAGITALWSLVAAAGLVGPATPIVVSNVVTAVVAVVFAGNLIRLPVDYFGLAANAKEFDQKASFLIQSQSPGETAVLRLVADYQLRRTLGPVLPDWLWRLRRQRLDEIWRNTRTRTATANG